MRHRIEAYLDQGHGCCYLKDTTVAGLVQEALLFHDQKKYRLVAWVIMPNHVHMLCTPLSGETLPGIMHSLKSFTSSKANTMPGRSGRFWQKEYFDRYIRNTRHFAKVVTYIENNPAKARLSDKPEDWMFSSAWVRAEGMV